MNAARLPVELIISAFVLATLCSPAMVRSQEPQPLKKALLIGDSIASGYSPVVSSLLAGEFTIRAAGGRQATSHSLERIDALLAEASWDVIHFNWGLWDVRHVLNPDGTVEPNYSMGAVTPDQYETNLRILIGKMEATGARLIWASTTPVLWDEPGKGRTDPDIQVYNARARDIMVEKGIQVDDLYSLVKPRLTELQSQAYGSDVHYTAEGYGVLGQGVADAIMIPEPGTLSLTVLGAVAFFRRRRRR